jgi:hypothetical protein
MARKPLSFLHFKAFFCSPYSCHDGSAAGEAKANCAGSRFLCCHLAARTLAASSWAFRHIVDPLCNYSSKTVKAAIAPVAARHAIKLVTQHDDNAVSME